jgi:hypothetical protein
MGMMDDAFVDIASMSAKVRNENRLLLEGLKAFEQKLYELVGGLNCSGRSEYVNFEEYIDQEGEMYGHIYGNLSFDGENLYVSYKEEPNPGYDEPFWEFKKIEEINIHWQRAVSNPKILESLVANLKVSLEEEFKKTEPIVNSLTQFLTIEKFEIDTDLDKLFEIDKDISSSWLKSRKFIQTDPEFSITLSCSHIETVLKSCLRLLGATGYKNDAIEKLSSKTMDVLKNKSVIDEATLQMFRGVSTFFLGVGTIRNAKSASHGKEKGYIPPDAELAQTVNHIAGIASVFVIKQTKLFLAKN